MNHPTPPLCLKALLSPDFIGSVAIVGALAATLVWIVITSPLGNLLTKGGLVVVGLLVAGFLFLMRVMVLPLWREATQKHPPA
jgi:hypothetical protein